MAEKGEISSYHVLYCDIALINAFRRYAYDSAMADRLAGLFAKNRSSRLRQVFGMKELLPRRRILASARNEREAIGRDAL